MSIVGDYLKDRKNPTTEGGGTDALGNPLPKAGTVEWLLMEAKTQREADQRQQKSLLEALTAASDNQIKALAEQNKTLLGQLTLQGEGFAKSQESLVQAQKDATLQAAKTAEAVLKQRDQQAQAVKRPNYTEIMRRQKALNSGGLSSTMLTGAGGVAPGALPLGGVSLLGA